MNKFMQIAKENADTGILKNEGGPFGAVIVDENNNIISKWEQPSFKSKRPNSTCRNCSNTRSMQKTKHIRFI